MNIGQFNDRVSRAVKRGTSLDAIIPFWTASAARLLEQNYTYSWMQRTTNASIAMGQVPLVVALDPLVKSVNWVKPRLVGSGGTEWYGLPLFGVDSMDITGMSGGNPQGYWLDGKDGSYTLNFDAIPQAIYTFRMSWNKYTQWPVDDAASPVLLLRGEYALFCQTLIIFANENRDPRMAEIYSGLLQGALSTLNRSEEEFKNQHQNDLRMNPGPLR